MYYNMIACRSKVLAYRTVYDLVLLIYQKDETIRVRIASHFSPDTT